MEHKFFFKKVKRGWISQFMICIFFFFSFFFCVFLGGVSCYKSVFVISRIYVYVLSGKYRAYTRKCIHICIIDSMVYRI